MAVTVLCLEVAFLVLALGWRAALQYRRTGDWGIRRPSTPAARVASAAMVGGFAASGIGPILHLVDVHRLESLEILPLRIGGLVLLVFAVGGTVHAQLALGSSWRVGMDPTETTELVIAGPFRLVRHPIFTWMITAAVGVALAVPGALSALGGVLVLCGAEIQARIVEERHLMRHHGPRYLDDARETGRFVPRIGRIRRPAESAGP